MDKFERLQKENEEMKCKCGLNPNDSQGEEQQKWESDFIKENGICNACFNSDDISNALETKK